MFPVEDLKDEVMRACGTAVVQAFIHLDEVSIVVPRTRLVEVMETLRNDPALMMTQLMDICGADYPGCPERFEVVYSLLSVAKNARVRVKVHTDEATPIPSVVGVFKSAGWYERETWDMFGVVFSGHPDLRRILTDYGFEGYPLRKDFPLTGFVEVRYDSEQRRIVYEPAKLAQDYRDFDFLSPWEGVTDVQFQRDESHASSTGEEK